VKRRGRVRRKISKRRYIKSSKVAVVKWADNNPITLASSCTSVSPPQKVRRFCKAEKIKVPVTYPNAVLQYNIHMGGVDLADMIVV